MKPNMYVRINSKENVVAMLSDRHRQLVIMGDALFQSFMSLILTIKEKGSVQRNGVSITYADFRRDHNGPIGKGYDHIWEYIESLEMFKFGLNSYYFLVNQEEDSVSDWSSHASVYPLDGLEEFVRTYIIIMIDRLVSIIGLSGVQTSLSFCSMLYSSMEELVQYTSNSFVKGMCYKKLSNYINPNKITSWTSDVKTISGTELVNAIKERDTVSQDSVYLCYDPNDLYKMTSLGEINNDFFIRLDELVELILAKEQVHMTLQKITIALKTSYEVLDSYLLKFPTPAQWLADPNPITVIKTMHMNDKKVFHPLQSVPYSDKNMTSIVYSLSNTIIKDNELEYAYYFKYPFKSQLVPYLNSFKIIKGDKYGVLPMCDNLIMGSSHTYKSSVLNSIIFRLLFSRELYTCTTHEEQDKLSISVEPLNPNKIMVIRLIVSEAREPVTVGSIDLSSELNKLSNYRTWVLPYSKIGYFLILLHQCYLLEDYYDHFVIVWDSMSDQLLGQWALQELQRTSQLKSEGLNTAARLDLSMIYALTEKFNNRGTGKKKRTSLSVIGSANTDTDKSTAVTFPQVNGIMMTAISMYGGSTYVPEGYDAIARLRMRRNSLFEDGIWQLESILRYQSKFEKEKKW